jgi:hypothetical protein
MTSATTWRDSLDLRGPGVWNTVGHDDKLGGFGAVSWG